MSTLPRRRLVVVLLLVLGGADATISVASVHPIDPINSLFGFIMGLVGGAALVTGTFPGRHESFTMRLATLLFGISFLTYGVLHIAEGLRFSWATPALRSKLCLWFFIPCFVVLVFGWIAQERRKRA